MNEIADRLRQAAAGKIGAYEPGLLDGAADEIERQQRAIVALTDSCKTLIAEMKECDGHCDCRGHDDVTLFAIESLLDPDLSENAGATESDLVALILADHAKRIDMLEKIHAESIRLRSGPNLIGGP